MGHRKHLAAFGAAAASAAVLAVASAAQGHGGGLNAEGCHNNRMTGD